MKKILSLLLTMMFLVPCTFAQTETIVLPRELREIETESFSGITTQKVLLPEGIQRIDHGAFADSNIGEINLPESVMFIDNQVFEGAQIGKLNLPEMLWQGSTLHKWAVQNAGNGYGYLPPADLRTSNRVLKPYEDLSLMFDKVSGADWYQVRVTRNNREVYTTDKIQDSDVQGNAVSVLIPGDYVNPGGLYLEVWVACYKDEYSVDRNERATCINFSVRNSTDLNDSTETAIADRNGIIEDRETETVATNISVKDFYTMVEHMLQALGVSDLTTYRNLYPAARVSENTITRYEAMILVFAAAEQLQITEFNNENWGELSSTIGEKCWEEIEWDRDLFGNIEEEMAGEWTRHVAAYFYSMGRMCPAHHQTLFDYDSGTNSMRLRDPITYDEACLALTRLAESMIEDLTVPEEERRGFYSDDPSINARAVSLLRDSIFLNEESEAGEQEIERMNERISEIKGTETAIKKGDTYIPGETYSGIAYYIDSEYGDNSFDGTSPEKAVKSMLALTEKLKFGDAVFFRRGQIHSYSDAMASLVDGLTLSAYGEGEKPVITCSPMELNEPEQWELYFENDGTRIWHAVSRNFGAVGWIDFNCSDDLYASPVYEYWTEENGFQYIQTIHRSLSDSSLDRDRYSQNQIDSCMTMSIEEELTNNLTFVSRVDYADAIAKGIPFYDYRGTDLYLRCDEGNPAEVFDIIKITDGSRVGPLQSVGSDQITLDNLNICNGGQWGVGHISHATIQNCEIGWIGNQVGDFNKDEETGELSVGYIGDGIYRCGDGSLIRNNYIHHTCCVGIVVEEEEEELEPLMIESNVICRNGIGYMWCNDGKWRQSSQEVTLQNNIMANQGQVDGILRWYNEFFGIVLRCFNDYDRVQGSAKIAAQHQIRNNTIIGGYQASIHVTAAGLACCKEFSENLFVGQPENHLMILPDFDLAVNYDQVLNQ